MRIHGTLVTVTLGNEMVVHLLRGLPPRTTTTRVQIRRATQTIRLQDPADDWLIVTRGRDTMLLSWNPGSREAVAEDR